MWVHVYIEGKEHMQEKNVYQGLQAALYVLLTPLIYISEFYKRNQSIN